jgi:hypothetical protein
MVQMLEDLQMFLLFLFRQRLSGNCRSFLTICFTALAMICLKDDLYRLRPSNFYPPAGFYATGSNDPFWNQNQDLFFKKFLFRLPHFRRLVDAMGLKDQYFRVSTRNRFKVRADVCLLVVLRRLSYPCRFWEMTEEFGMPSNRLCEIFHATLEIIYDRYHSLIEFETWLPYFSDFARVFEDYGSPYADFVGLIDGDFLRMCRPGGLGNRCSRLDQGQFYTGEKAAHGVKHLAAFFANGMMALAGPFLGSTSDGRMLGESIFQDLLREASLRDGRRYKLFGDAAFRISNFIQSMLKGEAAIQGSSQRARFQRSDVPHSSQHRASVRQSE